MKAIIDFKRYIWGEIAAGVISAGAAIYGNHQRNEAQRRENEKAFERERQQIAEMNAYNSASAQAARLQAAGLNPNLMYEQSPAQAAGQQQEIASYEPAEVTNAFGQVGAEGASIVNSLVGIREQENRNALAKIDVELKTANRDLAFANVELTKVEAKRRFTMLGYELDELAARAESEHTAAQLNRANIDVAKASVREKDAFVQEVKSKIEVNEQLENYYMELANKTSVDTMAVIEMLPSQIKMMNATAAERMAMVSKASYECRLIEAQELLTYAQRKGVKKDIEKAEAYIERLKNMTINDYINSATNGVYRIASSVAQFYAPGSNMASFYGSAAGGVLAPANPSSMAPSYGANGSIMGVDYY